MTAHTPGSVLKLWPTAVDRRKVATTAAQTPSHRTAKDQCLYTGGGKFARTLQRGQPVTVTNVPY